jgi:hypothetical protein
LPCVLREKRKANETKANNDSQAHVFLSLPPFTIPAVIIADC